MQVIMIIVNRDILEQHWLSLDRQGVASLIVEFEVDNVTLLRTEERIMTATSREPYSSTWHPLKWRKLVRFRTQSKQE